MKRQNTICGKCFKVDGVSIYGECTIDEAQEDLGTREDPQIAEDEIYIFPCKYCGKRTFMIGLEGLEKRKQTEDNEEIDNVVFLYDRYS